MTPSNSTHRPAAPSGTLAGSTTETRTDVRSRGFLRAKFGMSLQHARLRRGLTQGQVAEEVDLSLKYVGEIERGEANTTIDTIERLADAIGWNPIESLIQEPITEGVRRHLIAETEQMISGLAAMLKWLHAIDPALHPAGRLRPLLPGEDRLPTAPRARGRRRQRKE